jgi:hypothetical protein
MKALKPQYVTDNAGKKIAVMIPVREYELMLQELEEIEDVKLYDAVKSRGEKSIPFDTFLTQREKRNRNVKV